MITPSVRNSVSLVTLTLGLSGALTLGACSRAGSPVTQNGAVATPDGRVTIDFENEAQTYVDVYLVGEWREWRLGRVAPGAHTRLRLPARELATTSGYVRLAVLANAAQTTQAAKDPRATFTIAQPLAQLPEQRWVFRQTPLASPEILALRARAGDRSTRQ